jgi:putative heme transporter
MPADAQPRAAGTEMARWSAKALLIAGGVVLVGGVLWYARGAVVPLIVAALVATQVLPLIAWAQRHGVSRGLAVAGSMVGVVVISAGLALMFSSLLFGEIGSVGKNVSAGVDEVIVWLGDHTTWVREHEDDIRAFLKGILPAAKNAAGGLLSGLVGGLTLAAQLVSSALLTLVFLLYLLTSGDAVWSWIRDRFSTERRGRVEAAGSAAWNAAGGYVRGIALVAFIDSAVIGVGMVVIGTPNAGALALLSFVCLFIPILGAWVSGAVIVLVTLGAEGSAAAIAMTVVILVAQQLDSMFVTPLVYQKTVNLHPIVTLAGVIVGSQLMGIIGAFLTVPMIAVGWAVWKTLEQPRTEAAEASAPQVPAEAAAVG